MKAGWSSVPFEEAVEDVSGGNLKTPQSDFLPSGSFPIVDQGRALIAGFTNDESRLCHAELPVIVFGDHTRCLKYVDFAFCMGADGVKVLHARNGMNVKYLFHYLRQLGIHEAGYSRHFKFLKRHTVLVPPPEEQQRIAEVLDSADGLRAKRRHAIEQLEDLKRSIFLDMFGNLEGFDWNRGTVANLAAPTKGSIRTGPFGSDLLHSEFVEEGIAVLGIDNVVSNEFRWAELRYITEEKYRRLKRYSVAPGDVLISIMGTCGRCAVVPRDIGIAINTKHLCCISPDPAKCLPEFLHAYFLWHPMARAYLSRTTKGAIMGGLNMGIIKSMPIAFPPLQLQQLFVERLGKLGKAALAQEESLDQHQALFSSLRNRAFAGAL